MQKKHILTHFIAVLVVLGAAKLGFSEPLTIEQAPPVVEVSQLELGLDSSC